MKRLERLTAIAAEVACYERGGSPDPGKARAATVLTDAMLRAFGRPRGLDWWEHGEAAGAWLSGLVFSLDPSSVECPEA